VGCNYTSKLYSLSGPVNDAFLIADCLQRNCGFDAENICVLYDVPPGQKRGTYVDTEQLATRANILQRLRWLVSGAGPGDVVFFSFAGYGVQVDDTSETRFEGFDEAILPTDFQIGRDDGDCAVIAVDELHDILMGIPPNCSATMLMDCNHATSLVDVAGTLDGQLLAGLVFHDLCGLQGHTTKVSLARHDRDVWHSDRARVLHVRPRFQPMVSVCDPRKARVPTRPAMARSAPIAFCYSAASHGQTAIEMCMARDVEGLETRVMHGLLSWCFVRALDELKYDCTHMELFEAVRTQMTLIKENHLPSMNQEVLLTFSMPLSDPRTMKVVQSLAAKGSASPRFVQHRNFAFQADADSSVADTPALIRTVGKRRADSRQATPIFGIDIAPFCCKAEMVDHDDTVLESFRFGMCDDQTEACIKSQGQDDAVGEVVVDTEVGDEHPTSPRSRCAGRNAGPPVEKGCGNLRAAALDGDTERRRVQVWL